MLQHVFYYRCEFASRKNVVNDAALDKLLLSKKKSATIMHAKLSLIISLSQAISKVIPFRLCFMH